MKENIRQFVEAPTITILEALEAIDRNTHGFLLIADKDEKFFGVITDGDIRRALIAGYQMTDCIESFYNRNAKYLTAKNSMADATELFKSKAIKFLPITDGNGKLVNLITKQQVYSLLLQDVNVDLNYAFADLDECVVDHEIFHRPWGFYRTTVMNEYFQSKVISVNPKSQLSLQSHSRREEHWIVAHGHGIIQIGESTIEAKCGTVSFIPKGCKHRLTNTDDKESLIVIEVQVGDYFGEDDIIRYEDVYGRV